MSTIIVGYDTSRPAHQALRWAARQGRLRGWPVRVVQCWPESVIVGPWLIDELGTEEVARKQLDTTVSQIAALEDGVDIDATIVGGRPVPDLVAASEKAGMVVVGGRGIGGFADLLLGSVVHRLARRVACPLVVVRGDAAATPDEVVVGVDGSNASRAALAWAADEARLLDVPLMPLMAWSFLMPHGEAGPTSFRPEVGAVTARRELEGIVGDVLSEHDGLQVGHAVLCDRPAPALLASAGRNGLLVVGSHGSSGWSRFDVGSVTQQVLQHARATVVIVPDRAAASRG